MRTTIAESLLSFCRATIGYIELFLCGISSIMLLYVRNVSEEVIKYVGSHFIYIFIHEETDIVVINAFYSSFLHRICPYLFWVVHH